jgi:MYXO-CTERM domain-containing protein
MRARVIVKLSIVAVLLAISCGGGNCGGGGGCSGCGESPYEYPLNDPNRPDAITQDEAARVRITQHFLDFIKPQLPEVIRQQFGMQQGMYVDSNLVLHIPLPDQDLFDIGVAEARLRDAEALIWLTDLDTRTDIRFEPPNNVRITLSNLRLGINADLKEDVAGSTSSCPIEGDLGPFGPGPLRHAAEVSINAVIDPGVGPDPERALDIRVSIDDVQINSLDVHVNGNYCSTESDCQDCAVEVFGTCLDPGGRCVECEIFCGGITNGLLSLASALIDLIRPLLNSVLQPIVESLLGNALNDLNGSTARFEQQLSLATLVALDAFAAANPFGLFVAPEPGRFPVLDRGTGLGMEITTTGGAEGELADCIGELPDFVPIKGPVPEMLGTDSRNRPYHVGVTLASSLLNQMLYAVHRSGSLCLKLRTEDVRDLSGGRFTLNASLLSLLAADIAKLASDKAPVILELKPRNPATISLGNGMQTGVDAMGNPVYDWLIKLDLQELGIAFHVLMQDRYVRVFEVTSDIFVGMNVTVLPDNRLEIAVGDLKIDNFVEYYNEILPNADFAMVLPTLIEIAMQGLLQNALTFDLDISTAVSDALNGAPIFLRVNDIFRDGVQQDYLTMTITFTSSQTTSLMLSAETVASIHGDGDLIDRTGVRPRPSGQVRLAVEPQLDQEYQIRVDRGLWRTWRKAQPDGTIGFEDAHLMLPGPHDIEVRSRIAGQYITLDPSPVTLKALVDPVPPSLRAKIDGDRIVVSVTDRETERGGPLFLQGRTDGGAWFDIQLTPIEADDFVNCWAELPLSAFAGAKELELRASDPRGNYSEIESLRLSLTGEEPAAANDGGGCACSSSGGSQSAGGIALLALVLGLRLAWRRRPSSKARSC